MRTILLDTSHALVAIKCKKNNSIVCTNTKLLDTDSGHQQELLPEEGSRTCKKDCSNNYLIYCNDANHRAELCGQYVDVQLETCLQMTIARTVCW